MSRLGRIAGLLAFGAALLGPIRPAHAGQTEDRLFREANTLYSSGKYAEARERYEQLVRRDLENERLFYNLGNTYFRQGQLGRAIWAYERALKLAPDHPEARYNLELAHETVHSRVRDKLIGVKSPPFWERTVKTFSMRAATIWFLVLWYLTFGLLMAVLLLRRGVIRAALTAVTALLGVAAICFAAIYYGRIYLDERAKQAIVLEDKVPVREGPRGIATKSFDIHAGLKVVIAAREDKWLKIRLPNGLEGWVRAESMGEL